MAIRPIETLYKGYRLRSRLEARWAVFFEALGLEWHYEHQGYDLGFFGWYLPDFWFPRLACFAEVKPTTFTAEEWAKCVTLPKPCLMLDGVPAVRPYHLALCWAFEGSEWEMDGYEHYLSADLRGTVNIAYSSAKKRIWYIYGGKEEWHWGDHGATQAAVDAARSARFEHGESGAT